MRDEYTDLLQNKFILFGAPSQSRTGTGVSPQDFESSASTNSTIGAQIKTII